MRHAEPVVTIVLGPRSARRWVIAAGRSGKPVDEWVRGFIDRIIEAEMAGRRTAVEREMIHPRHLPKFRKCAFCGEPARSQTNSSTRLLRRRVPRASLA